MPKQKFFGSMMYESMRNEEFRDARIAEYRIEKKQETPQMRSVGRNEIFLGCLDEDYLEPVTIPYNSKSFAMGIFAGKGDGKTQLVKHLAFSQIHDRFGYNLFIIDPKNDYSNISQGQNIPQLVERLKRFGIASHGYEAAYWKPAFFNLTDRKGTEYLITLRDFENLEYAKRAEAMKEFFMIDEKTPAGKALNWMLSKRVPKTLQALRQLMKEYKKYIIKMREDSGSKVKVVSSAMDIAIEDKIRQGLLGEEGQKITLEVDDDGKAIKTKTVHASHFPEDLCKPSIVVLQADLEAEKSYISSCYAKLAIASVWQDRYNYVTSHGEQGVLSKPSFLILDEADVLCPREGTNRTSPSREQINQLSRRGRQFGWGTITITQQPEQISREHIRHLDYVMTTRLRSEKMIQILKEKFSLEDFEINELKRIPYDINSPIKHWIIFTGNPAEKYKVFVPAPPNIAMKQENQ